MLRSKIAAFFYLILFLHLLTIKPCDKAHVVVRAPLEIIQGLKRKSVGNGGESISAAITER
jgi:hypothetical protein